MDQVVFPAGLIIDFSDLNIEMMNFYSKKWNLEQMQLEKGSLNIKLLAAHTPRIQIAKAEHSLGMMTKGEFPKGCVVLNSYFENSGAKNAPNRPPIAFASGQ